MFVEGTLVSYRHFQGTIAFCCNSYVTILIKQGNHPVHDVKIIVYKEDYKSIYAHSS